VIHPIIGAVLRGRLSGPELPNDRSSGAASTSPGSVWTACRNGWPGSYVSLRRG
jgi:hypothetical protein